VQGKWATTEIEIEVQQSEVMTYEKGHGCKQFNHKTVGTRESELRMERDMPEARCKSRGTERRFSLLYARLNKLNLAQGSRGLTSVSHTDYLNGRIT